LNDSIISGRYGKTDVNATGSAKRHIAANFGQPTTARFGAYNKPNIVSWLVGSVGFLLIPFAMIFGGFFSAP
jgi:hypothetical protein